MRSHPRIADAVLLGRPLIVAAAIAVLAIPSCSQPTSELAPSSHAGAAQSWKADPPERGAGDRSQRVESANELSDATTTPRPPAVTPPRTEPPPPSKREVMLRRFTSRYGRDNVVVIRVSHADGLRPGVLVAQLAQDLGSEHFLATPPSAEALLAVNYSGEIEDVTQHIDWGKVTSTDRQQRLILVDGDSN